MSPDQKRTKESELTQFVCEEDSLASLINNDSRLKSPVKRHIKEKQDGLKKLRNIIMEVNRSDRYINESSDSESNENNLDVKLPAPTFMTF